jgi:hypothetical protein
LNSDRGSAIAAVSASITAKSAGKSALPTRTRSTRPCP